MRPAFVSTLLVTAAVASLGLGGCADNAYYQTRYTPTSSDESYSVTERMFWTEDREVYGLPANPPALATGETDGSDDHRKRLECQQPGQRFKSLQVATGNGSEIHGTSLVDSPTLVAQGDEQSGRGPGPDRRLPIAGEYDAPVNGALDHREVIPVAVKNERSASVRGEGIDRRPAEVLVGTRDDEGWCPPKR